jgi:tetratricopeptide (TPR) repeat protein
VPLKRQWFRPGRRIEQIGKLAEHAFFRRRKAAKTSPANSGMPATSPRLGLLPSLAENAGALFSIMISVVLIAAIVALLISFAREIRRETIVLDEFTAPEDVVKAGYTSTVIAEKILDEIRAIDTAATTWKARRDLDTSSAIPDLQVAGSGMSMRSIVRYARRLVDAADERVGGEITRGADGLHMTLRARGPRGTEVVPIKQTDGDVARLLKDAAQSVVQLTDPFVLASYLFEREAPSKRFPETLAAIDYVLKHAPVDDDAWALNLLGNVRDEEGKREEAINAYREALKRAPDFHLARGNLAWDLVQAGRPREAVPLFSNIRPDSLKTAEDAIGYALVANSLDRHAEALAFTQRATVLAPQRFRPCRFMAVEQWFVHRYEQGLKTLQRCETMDPEAVRIHFIKPRLLTEVGRGREALAHLDAASTTDEDLVLWQHAERGFALARIGRHDAAIDEYRVAVGGTLNHRRYTFVNWGDTLIALGKPLEAVDKMRAAVKVGSEVGFSRPHAGLGRALLAAGNPAEAIKSFEAAFVNDPNDPVALRDWAKALDALGRKADADAKRKQAEVVERENGQTIVVAK